MVTDVIDVASSSTVDVLRHLHGILDLRFRERRDMRQTLEPASPVFALEHDMSAADLGGAWYGGGSAVHRWLDI